MCVSNHRNDYFDDLNFDSDERLITKPRIYFINDDIVKRLNNGLILTYIIIKYDKNKSLV